MATVYEPASQLHAAPRSPEIMRKAGLFRRIVRAVMDARQRQADREIREILQRRGGVMCDSLERPDGHQRRKPLRRLPALQPRA